MNLFYTYYNYNLYCIYIKKYKMWWSHNWETTFVYFFLTKQKNAIFKVAAGRDNTI